jgi:hypothetical protein
MSRHVPRRFLTAPRGVDHQLVPLDARWAEAWAWWPALVGRVSRFVTRYDADMDLIPFVAHLQQRFAGGDPRQHLVLLVARPTMDAPLTDVGHVVATVESRGGRRLGFIWQLEFDTPPPRALRRQGQADLAAWAIAQGCTALELWTPHDPRVWARLTGFTPVRTIMRYPLASAASMVECPQPADGRAPAWTAP